jgi:hypothetical protein
MGHGASNVRQSDVKRAILGAEAAGKKVTSVEIEGGVVKIKVNDGNDEPVDSATDGNPWDKVDPQ